jgi:hypothetical protein
MIHVRNAVIAFLVAGVVAFGLSFWMASVGAQPGFEVQVLATMLGVFTFYILWNLSGNRKVARASAEEREAALSLIPPPGQALVYVVRKGFVARAAGMTVSLDGAPRGHLKAPQFTCFAAAPGPHELSAEFGGGAGAQSRAQTQSLVLEEGKAVGVLATVKMGAIQGSIAFEPLAGQALQQTIRGMTMVAPLERPAG